MSDDLSYITDRIDLVSSIQHEDDYYRALGRFIHTFAQVEVTLKAFLGKLTGLSPEEANAVFSGVRSKVAMDNIKRLHEARKLTPDPAYASITDQLSQIASARDSIVHYGAKFERGRPTEVSNERAAHTQAKIRSFPISVTLLDAMDEDLEEIKRRIHAAFWRKDLPDETHKFMFGDLEPPTWRYKHNAQPIQPNKTRSSAPTRKRQRRSSPE